eukprot:TRINITY_DN145_c0_g1_i2.p1 TRINITY_DN145_c0_g1~~TRINITY_DN145_c0_g1_i2.p1  ORF type:complete len:518 (-),score=67.71 TRINITY_DN145_c0_g1_i2:672-2225(-)
MPWFPHFATRAYVETLELRRSILEKRRPSWSTRPRIVEPASPEFLSALAAGIHAQHIVQVGCGLSTVALASAAKTTGSVLISLHTQAEKQKIVKQALLSYGLLDHVQFFCGNPCDIVSRRQGIDFVFIGGDADTYIDLFDLLDLKPGAIVVADYALDDSTNEYIRHVRRQPGVESSTLPVGRGLEITKVIKWDDFNKGRKRYVGSPSLGRSRLGDTQDSPSSRHSDVFSDSASSVRSNPTSVSSVVAAEAWMASKLATYYRGKGNSDEASDVETDSYVAEDLALSVDSSYAEHSWSVHGGDDTVILRNGFFSSPADFESNKSDPPDAAQHTEVQHVEPDGHVLQEPIHLCNWIASRKAETDISNKHKSPIPVPNAEAFESESVRCEDLKETSSDVYSCNECANRVGTGISGSRQAVEPLNGTSIKLLVSEETQRLSQGRLEYVGGALASGGVIEQKLSGESVQSEVQDPKFKITFQDDNSQTAVMIQGVDQDMLLFDITMAFNDSGVRRLIYIPETN